MPERARLAAHRASLAPCYTHIHTSHPSSHGTVAAVAGFISILEQRREVVPHIHPNLAKHACHSRLLDAREGQGATSIVTVTHTRLLQPRADRTVHPCAAIRAPRPQPRHATPHTHTRTHTASRASSAMHAHRRPHGRSHKWLTPRQPSANGHRAAVVARPSVPSPPRSASRESAPSSPSPLRRAVLGIFRPTGRGVGRRARSSTGVPVSDCPVWMERVAVVPRRHRGDPSNAHTRPPVNPEARARRGNRR